MVTESQMYWLTRMDDLRSLLYTVTILSAIFGVVAMVALVIVSICASSGDRVLADVVKGRLFRWLGPVLLTLTLCAGLTHALLPSTRDYAAIMVIPAVLNSERTATIQKDAGELYDLTVEWAKSQLKTTKDAQKAERAQTR